MKKCVICSHNLFFDKKALFDERYGYPGRFSLLKCSSCAHSNLDVEFSSEQLLGLYSNYYPRSNFHENDYQPHQEIAGFKAWFDGAKSSTFRWVPKNVRVLDIGCGFGESLGYHQARGCEVFGVEADENIRRVAEKYGYDVHVGLFDPTIYKENYFDYVTMSQVVEHIVDPVQTLQGIARILKPCGSIILSTPNASGWGVKVFGKYWINWHAPYHLQFFTTKSMSLAAEKAGLRMERHSTTTPSAWLLYQWIHLFTFPVEGDASCFWSPNKANLTMTKKIGIKMLSLIHRSKINHLITRLFDALGYGDNFVFILKKL